MYFLLRASERARGGNVRSSERANKEAGESVKMWNLLPLRFVSVTLNPSASINRGNVLTCLEALKVL